jgi:hypothetical protein
MYAAPYIGNSDVQHSAGSTAVSYMQAAEQLAIFVQFFLPKATHAERRQRWVRHVARMGDKKIAWKVLVVGPKGKRALERPTERKQDSKNRQS